MSQKRLVFNTADPNDQGGIIPNDVIDFKRYGINPVLCFYHQWSSYPVGRMTDIKLEGGKYSGIPEFHRKTQQSIECADMYDAGYLNACSIGGFSEWKTNAAGQPQLDADGNRICAYFDLYEISICTLPSNPKAVVTQLTAADFKTELGAKYYEKDEISKVSASITTLSSQLNHKNVETKTPELLAAEKKLADAEAEITRLKAEAGKSNNSVIDQQIDAAQKELARLQSEKDKLEKLQAAGAKDIPSELPGLLKSILSFASDVLGLKSKAENISAPDGAKGDPKLADKDPLTEKTSDKITLKSKKVEAAKEKMEKAKEAAAKALEKAKELKAKADSDDAGEGAMDEYKSAKDAADKAVQAAEDTEKDYKAAVEEDDDDDDDAGDKKKSKNSAEKTTNAADGRTKTTTETTRPLLKTVEELKAEAVALAAPPTRETPKTVKYKELTFSALTAAAKKNPTSDEGKIYNRVMTGDLNRSIGDYAVILNSIINDPKYAAIVEKVRFHSNLTGDRYANMVGMDPKKRGGEDILTLA